LQQAARGRGPSFRAACGRFVAGPWRLASPLGTVRGIGASPPHFTARSLIMLIAIVQHTPAWVWGLLSVLIAFGLWQTRDREMSLARVTILPLVMIALSLSGVFSAFGHTPVALGGWAAGVSAALAFARQIVSVRGATWSAQTATLHVPGSWLPLALIVALFSVKYFVGVKLAMHPALAADTNFAGLCSLAYGGFSGLFLARGISLRSLARRPTELQAA
jgi:hypothetical protein